MRCGRGTTLAPPVFGIRHVPELEAGKNNPDFPGLFVFFDTPLITPDGTVFPKFHNFASAFNVLGTDDTRAWDDDLGRLARARIDSR
jgi:hypothetical protein